MRKFIYEGEAWPELQTHNINGMRFYEVGGEKYPSITSVLGSRPEKAAGIQAWRERIGEAQANIISRKAALHFSVGSGQRILVTLEIRASQLRLHDRHRPW